jgi:MvaI/BcnI restriction endonuclease family
MNTLLNYAQDLAEKASVKIVKGQFFAKILTKNDDSGRHGVLIPTDAYHFFPEFEILDAKENQTMEFLSIDAKNGEPMQLAYKYYERYPERRITRINPLINNFSFGERIQIVLRAELADGSIAYIHDSSNEQGDGRLNALWEMLTGGEIAPMQGTYIIAPIDFNGLQIDGPLNTLLNKFDSFRGTWVESQRTGDTGIGYTLETLLEIKENNDKKADFLGIEIKAKHKKIAQKSEGKLNLFQQGPIWSQDLSAKERIRLIGIQNEQALYTCYSQITTKLNNLDLSLSLKPHSIYLKKNMDDIGHWLNSKLSERLHEKHQRAAFILAAEKTVKSTKYFLYEDLIYCEQPSIENFLSLVEQNQIVFEFTMSEKENGTIRNHGYPWRLNHSELLDQLFAFKVKLR